jgi:hypothetical protein
LRSRFARCLLYNTSSARPWLIANAESAIAPDAAENLIIVPQKTTLYTLKRTETLGTSEVRKSSSYVNADAVETSAGVAKSKSGQRLGRRGTFLFQMMAFCS